MKKDCLLMVMMSMNGRVFCLKDLVQPRRLVWQFELENTKSCMMPRDTENHVSML